MSQELEHATALIEELVRGFHRQKEDYRHESEESDAYRYRYGGARDMLMAVTSPQVKAQVLSEVRRRTRLKIPHAGDRTPDGGYYARTRTLIFDSGRSRSPLG